ncbi:MAG: hypothetical protein ABIY51_02925 [Ferruginibacter sp.]
MTYKLKEKLDGSTRITTGIWQEWIKEGVQKIQFLNIPGYKIENNSTLKIENSNEQFSNVKIFYKDTDSIILLPYAYGFFQKDTIGLMGLHSNDFKNFTFSEKLDSLFLGMVKYKNVTIKIPDTLKHSYILRFYPTETISNFDRVYNITGGNFKPLDSTNRDKRLRFKKSGV